MAALADREAPSLGLSKELVLKDSFLNPTDQRGVFSYMLLLNPGSFLHSSI